MTRVEILLEWAEDCDKRFYWEKRRLYCTNPEHEPFDPFGGGEFAEMLEWTGDHWNCHE